MPLTVTNNGSGKEDGTITISRSLSAGLRVTGVSGTGWTCSDASWRLYQHGQPRVPVRENRRC